MCVSAYVCVKHMYCVKRNYENTFVFKNGNLGGGGTFLLTVPCTFCLEHCRESVLVLTVWARPFFFQSMSDLG